MDTQKIQNQISTLGFTVISNVFNTTEIENIIEKIPIANTTNPAFKTSADLFAIRNFFKEIPALKPLVFNQQLQLIIQQIFGEDYFVVKSIYFDKPPESNWFVAYHQDLSISVEKKIKVDGYNRWTVKQNQFSVQPPIEILKNNFTVRIHLDDTNAENGALKVIPSSHQKGIYRPENINWEIEKEIICNVDKGGIMLMKPLLLHASSRTTNQQKRRVIHIEFSNCELLDGLEWVEKEN